jgi:hypothetical protein
VLRKLLIKKQSIDVTKIHGKKNQKFNHFDYEMEDYPYEDNSNEDCTMLGEGSLFGGMACSFTHRTPRRGLGQACQ